MLLEDVGLTSIALLHAIFTVFYVDMFARHHVLRIDDNNLVVAAKSNGQIVCYLVLGQLLYALWGVAKSVVFERSGNKCRFVVTRLRLWRLSRSGPLWAVLFALLWLHPAAPLLHPAVRFTLCMAVYDALMAYCEEAVQARTMGESRANERTFLAGDVAGGFGVAVACFLSDWKGVGSHETRTFCFFTTACAFVTAITLYVCGRQQRKGVKAIEDVEGNRVNSYDFFWFAQQTMRRCSMKAAMLLWALQGYSSAFATCFFNILLTMCKKRPSTLMHAFMLLLAFVVPHVVVAVVVSFYKRVGKKRVVSFFLTLRMIVGLFFIVLAMKGDRVFLHCVETAAPFSFFALLLFLNLVLTRVVGHLQEFILHDLVDEDAVIFSRLNPTTRIMRQLLRTASKPCESMALVVTFPIVVFLGCGHAAGVEACGGVAWLAGGTSLLTALLSLWGWRRHYNLDGSHMQFVRMAVRKRADGEAQIV